MPKQKCMEFSIVFYIPYKGPEHTAETNKIIKNVEKALGKLRKKLKPVDGAILDISYVKKEIR